jgi:hypothetical protein
MPPASSKQIQTKRKITTKATPSVIAAPGPAGDLEERLQWIATAAYYKAAGRGFVPGEELNDWLQAELELDGAGEPMK